MSVVSADSTWTLPDAYTAYAYGYPHKSAYARLAPAPRLRDIWRDEDKRALFLYVHLPFCEMRCGFCNLFTQAQPGGDIVDAYLDRLEVQARVVREALGPAGVARLALGGGTPTFLSARQLERTFDLIEAAWDAAPRRLPTSVETSPATADRERMLVLRERGVTRVSIGVQSFLDEETRALGRPQRASDVHQALENIRALAFPVLNVDLIYGVADQTLASWLGSVREALRYRPEEIFLYPLYVRPQTGLGRRQHHASALRQTLYRAARDLLLGEGYEQSSMRAFRRHAGTEGPAYCCQRDGMVGLGCGARSYTRRLHYAHAFAVAQPEVQALIRQWLALTPADFAHATHGFALDEDERRRRFVILSLLQADGLEEEAYTRDFGGSVYEHLPILRLLIERGLAVAGEGRLRLTDEGLELSDAVGPALYSPRVRAALERFVQS